MERCPCCKARLGGATQCPRCQADLSIVIGAEQSAQFWLAKAIYYWNDNEVENSSGALTHSLHLKQTRLALVFRDFIIQQQCRQILDLLAQKKILPAKQRLFKMRLFIPESYLLQQLSSFTDHSLALLS